MKASSEIALRRARHSSAGAPMARTLPACISEMRSQRSASFMKWVEMKIVTPSSRERPISSRQNRSRATGSTPEVGSSRIRTSGACMHGDRELQALAHAERQAFRRMVREVARDRNAPACRRRARGDCAPRQIEQLRVQRQILPHRQFGVEREALRHVADAPPRRHVAGVELFPEQPRLPLAWRQQAGQHFHRRRFAAAIGAEKAENLAAPDAEVHMVDGGEIAEAAGEIFRLDGEAAAVVGQGRQDDRRMIGARQKGCLILLPLRNNMVIANLRLINSLCLLRVGKRIRRFFRGAGRAGPEISGPDDSAPK